MDRVRYRKDLDDGGVAGGQGASVVDEVRLRPERPRREILLLVSGRDIPEPTPKSWPKTNNVCAIVTSHSAVVAIMPTSQSDVENL
jgi:hypothetical protein